MKMPDLYLDNIQKMRAIIAEKRVCCSYALFFVSAKSPGV